MTELQAPGPKAHMLARFGLNSPGAARLAQFYVRACGARLQRCERLDELRSSGLSALRGGAERRVLAVGQAILELWQFDQPGRPYPQILPPYDNRFQHIAIVVTDMQRARENLKQAAGWSAISTNGPQTLPQSTGGVTAFKFRDPDGHPVEFLQFPSGNIPTYWQTRAAPGICSGIDHSAISVADVERSMHFYQSLGLELSARTLNQGSRQAYLDGIAQPLVDVIGLAPPEPTPHVELLHYHLERRPAPHPIAVNDVGATRLIFTSPQSASPGEGCLLQDPDGHWLQLEHRQRQTRRTGAVQAGEPAQRGAAR